MPRKMYLILVLLSLIWGGSFFFMKLLLTDYGPWSIAFLRSAFGLIVIIAIMLFLREPFHLRKLPWFPLIAVSLLNTAIPWALIALSETRLTSSMASVLNATTPLWTLVVGITFFRAKTTPNQWLGMVIGFIGILILLDFNPVSIIAVDLWGFIGMVTATLCYGLASQLLKRFVIGFSVYQITFSTLLISVIGSAGFAFGSESFSLAPLAEVKTIMVLIGLGMFGSGIAYVMYYHLIQKGSPEFASMVTYLVPVTAILWGYSLLNEEIHWTLVGGLLCILCGVFLANRKRKSVVEQPQAISSSVSS